MRNVGSCRRSLVSASPIFCLSAPLLGSIDMLMTGSGKLGRSRMIGWSGSQSVSPVLASSMPITAMMSPASAESRASRSSALIWNMRLTFSRVFLFAFSTRVPLSSVPL